MSKAAIQIRDAHAEYKRAIGTPLESAAYAKLQEAVRKAVVR